MQRRKFLSVSAVGTTAIMITGISCKSRRSDFYNILDKPARLSGICDVKTIMEIGKTYYLQTPAERGTDKLADLLSVDFAGNKIPSSSKELFIQNLMNQKINHDFETDHTVIVNGWVLTVTEARQCALLYSMNQ